MRRAEGDVGPDWFYMDMRDVPWDGSAGVTLVGAWDGHGMTATQSHGMQFDDFPAIRAAWPEYNERQDAEARDKASGFFPSVIVGIVEVALDTARKQLERRRGSLGAFEQVEWIRAKVEGWLVQQAYEGMLRSMEEAAGRDVLKGKTAIAEPSASVLDRLCKVVVGGTYARQSPFCFWLQDVRALGFLRPPWGLAYGEVFDAIPRASDTGSAPGSTNGAPTTNSVFQLTGSRSAPDARSIIRTPGYRQHPCYPA